MKVFSNWLMKMPSFCIRSVIRVLKESGNPFPYPFRNPSFPRHACVLLWLCIGEQYGNSFSHGILHAIILSRKKKDRFKAMTSHLSLPPTRQLNDTISALHLQGFDWRKGHFRCEFCDGTGQVLQCIGRNGPQPREMRILRKNRRFLRSRLLQKKDCRHGRSLLCPHHADEVPRLQRDARDSDYQPVFH